MYKKMSEVMKGRIQALLDCVEKNNVAYFVGSPFAGHPERGSTMATEPMDDTSLYIHRLKLENPVGWITHVCMTTQVTDEHAVKHSYWYDGTDDEWITERLTQMQERSHRLPQNYKEVEE